MRTPTEFEGMVEKFGADKVEYAQNELSMHPKEHDPEWAEYLLDQLSDSELINGAPTVDGLRRITEKCFGEIIGSKSDIIDTPTSQNNQRCTIKHTLTIAKYGTSHNIMVDGSVDVLYHKTPYPFKDH